MGQHAAKHPASVAARACVPDSSAVVNSHTVLSFVLGCFPQVLLVANQFLCSRKAMISLADFSQAAFPASLLSQETVWVCLGSVRVSGQLDPQIVWF